MTVKAYFSNDVGLAETNHLVLDMSTCLWRAVMGTEKGAGGGQASM